MKSDAYEARNTQAPTISSGSASRPSGILAILLRQLGILLDVDGSWGDDQRRPEGVYVDVIRRPLQRQRLGDHFHGALGGAVAHVAAVLPRMPRTDERLMILPAFLSLKTCADLLAGDHDAGDVDVHQLAPVVHGILERIALDIQAQGVDQNIDGADLLDNCLTISLTLSSLVTSQLMPITSLPVSAEISLAVSSCAFC